jgi:RNA-splicing ligase RtcB
MPSASLIFILAPSSPLVPSLRPRNGSTLLSSEATLAAEWLGTRPRSLEAKLMVTRERKSLRSFADLRDHGGHSYSTGEQWDSALGTIGAGNHFAEIQVVEESSLATTENGLQQNDVILIVHSGSRGYGGSVLKKYTETSTNFEEGSADAIEYTKEHDKACEWAKANRDLITLRFLACLEPGNENWSLGSSNADDFGEESTKMVKLARKALQQRKVVDIWHNNVERVPWPPSAPSLTPKDAKSASSLTEATDKLTLSDSAAQEYAYIHRKGAAPTYDPKTQVPLSLLPLPGSRGTPTLILQPTFSASICWGLKNGLSLAHGAGRAMSRAKALSSLEQKYKGQNILEPQSIDTEGTWVICDEKDLVFEEAPDAYKDVEAVGQDLVDAGAAIIVGWCRARISYKIRNEAR